MEFLASILTTIADQLQIPAVNKTAALPGVRDVYRLTIRYHDRRAHDSVATLIRRGSDGARLEVVYQGLFEHKAMHFPMTQKAYEGLVQGFQQMRFDHLSDQPNIPSYGVDLWLWERAAGTFYKSVILAPELADGTYWKLARLAWTYIDEAVREIKRG